MEIVISIKQISLCVTVIERVKYFVDSEVFENMMLVLFNVYISNVINNRN